MKYSFNKNNNNNNKKGFTILETMVAVFILTLSVTGPMVFAQSGLRAAFLARDQITAFYLAQDVIETIKNIRDQNALNDNPQWLTNIKACSESGPCPIYVDTTDTGEGAPMAVQCYGGTCPTLHIDSHGRFGYGGDEESRFTRTTYVNEIVEDQEAQIVVEVEWKSNIRTGNAHILVQENIYNWIPVVQ